MIAVPLVYVSKGVIPRFREDDYCLAGGFLTKNDARKVVERTMKGPAKKVFRSSTVLQFNIFNIFNMQNLQNPRGLQHVTPYSPIFTPGHRYVQLLEGIAAIGGQSSLRPKRSFYRSHFKGKRGKVRCFGENMILR